MIQSKTPQISIITSSYLIQNKNPAMINRGVVIFNDIFSLNTVPGKNFVRDFGIYQSSSRTQFPRKFVYIDKFPWNSLHGIKDQAILFRRNQSILSHGRQVENLEKDGTGIAHVLSCSNNTILTITDIDGNTRAWISCGSRGFKGARRKTSYAAQDAAETIGIRCKELGIRQITIRVRGFGPGRESAIRGLHNSGLTISCIQDCTPRPHNGSRPKKRTRG